MPVRTHLPAASAAPLIPAPLAARPRAATDGRPPALPAVLVHKCQTGSGSPSLTRRSDVTSRHTKHSIICDPADGQEHGEKGPLSCRPWLALVDPAALPGPGFPFREQCSTGDRLEIPARSGTALLSRTWCPQFNVRQRH